MKKLSYLLAAILAIFGITNNSHDISSNFLNITEDSPVILKHSSETQSIGFILNTDSAQSDISKLYHYSHSSHRSHYSHSSHRSHYSGY